MNYFVATVVVLRIVSGLAILYGVLRAYRWIRERSVLVATIFTVGILSRAVGGVLLFLTSWLHLPVLSRLQTGGGFWILAPDAHMYFNEAAVAVNRGMSTISGSVASPAYVRALTAWMMVVGVSPASAVLFNVVCFTIVSVIIVRVAESRMAAAAVSLCALTVSPALAIFSTQALKESFCVLAMTTTLAGLWLWCRVLRPAAGGGRVIVLAAGALCMAVGVYEIAGIRAYIAVFLILAMLAASAVCVARGAGRRWWVLTAQVVLVVILGLAFRAGAGDYYTFYANAASRMVTGSAAPLSNLDQARAGFVATGGATSFVAAGAASHIAPRLAPGASLLERVRHTATGCVALFVPISVARTLSLLDFSGGRGLLLITDLDTVVMDLLIIIGLFVVFRDQPRFWLSPVIVFVLVFSAITTLAMAYVVTNFGTLFRLRLLIAVPLWLLPALAMPQGVCIDGTDDQSTDISPSTAGGFAESRLSRDDPTVGISRSLLNPGGE